LLQTPQVLLGLGIDISGAQPKVCRVTVTKPDKALAPLPGGLFASEILLFGLLRKNCGALRFA